MGVSSYTSTEYTIECDCCFDREICPDSNGEGVHSKQQAIKWAGFHKTKNGKILCENCFQEYRRMRKL